MVHITMVIEQYKNATWLATTDDKAYLQVLNFYP